MKDIIINTEDRFIGRHKDHRISIVRVDDMFDLDIQDKTHMNIMEMHSYFKNMKEVIRFAKKYVNRNG